MSKQPELLILFSGLFLLVFFPGRGLCRFTGFVLTLFGMVSIYTLCALSYQRWVVVTRPNWVDINSARATAALIGAAW